MKKFISIVLCLVLVFSFSMPSFAVGDHDTELDALNNIDYYVYWIFEDFSDKLDTLNERVLNIFLRLMDTIGVSVNNMDGYLSDIKTNVSSSIVPNLSNSLAQLLDINDFTRSSYDELKRIRENLFGETLYLQSFASVVSDNLLTLVTNENNLKSNFWRTDDSYQDSFYKYIANDLNSLKQREWALWNASLKWESFTTSWYYQVYDNLEMLQQVLADEDDLALKESQKANQESAFDSFFFNDDSYDTSTSLSPGSFSALSDGFKSVQRYFGVESNSEDTISDGFYLITEIFAGNDPTESGSSPLSWFSAETALDIDKSGLTYSLRSNKPVIVTDYYESQFDYLKSFRSRGDN